MAHFEPHRCGTPEPVALADELHHGPLISSAWLAIWISGNTAYLKQTSEL
jgi:hypothetical protein